MARSRRRWQLVGFLGAVVLPSVILVAVGQRTIQQNRELAGKRRQDERRVVREWLGRELLARAEQVKAAALRDPQGPAPEVAMVARVEGNRLVPPWETGL